MIQGLDWLDTKGNKEFDVSSRDFGDLELRKPEAPNKPHYFYDTKHSKLITDFVLYDGTRVATICTVTIVNNDGEYTPRLKFWKKDKTKKGSSDVLELEIPDMPETRMVKSLVDTDTGHRNLWILLDFLRNCSQLAIPASSVKIIESDSADIVELLQGSEKDKIVDAIKSVLGGNLTQAELDTIADRKGKLKMFADLLNDSEYFARVQQQRQDAGRDSKPEAIWQSFFEANQWIFGYGLNLVACQAYDNSKLEQITTGASRFAGAGKRTDALLRTRGVVSSLMFCEIKRPDTALINGTQYRKPDVWSVSSDVVGAVAQVQKTAEKAVRDVREFLHQQSGPDGEPANLTVATVRPRQVVVVGDTSQLGSDAGINGEKVAAFELFRRSNTDVEVITFDELYARACFIIHD